MVMPEYRRAFEPGGTFFFTVVTERRAPILCNDIARTCLREAIEETRSRWSFTIDAIVLLPDHLHTLWSLPDNDSNFSRRWAFLKKTFTQKWLDRQGHEQPVSISRTHNRRRGIWQRRFWEHTIRDDRDFQRHCDYIHYNPIKHGLATCPHRWPYSTFPKWVQNGIYDQSWQCTCTHQAVTPIDFVDLCETAME